MHLLKEQQRLAKEHLDTTIFVEGYAGTGKTTAAIERIKTLIRQGVAAEEILVFVPQMALALPYQEALRRSRLELGGRVRYMTLGSLSYQMVDLFWPLLVEELVLEHPNEPPYFLSLELIQYYMMRFIEPEIKRNDYFNSVHISRNRLYTQIVDNLNKASLVNFSHDSLGERLKSAWGGDIEQAYIYDDAQAIASLFRDICRRYNLLDFSLQVKLFKDILWPKPEVQAYLKQQFRHLIVDNIEEDNPASHDLMLNWIQSCESAVLIYDKDAGFRRFLGADSESAYQLKAACQVHLQLEKQRVMSAHLQAFQSELAQNLRHAQIEKSPKEGKAAEAIVYTDNRYHPQMLDWVVDNLAALVHGQGVPPQEIVVLAPFLPDALRFALKSRLDERQVPSRSHRPSRSLREEAAARTLLTLAKLAHPQWLITPGKFDVAYALKASIQDLDLIRARLLVDILYRNGELVPFENIRDENALQRISFDLGARYSRLSSWLAEYRQTAEKLPIDVFMSRLFGELLSQPDFGFHAQFEAAHIAAKLIDSAREFRQTVGKIEPDLDTAAEYVRMVDAGVLANLYLPDWKDSQSEAILIAPAHTFLMKNQAVDYQFWLNVGSGGWGQRLYQPLTHPYVLSRQWQIGRKWTDLDEQQANQESLNKLVMGLIRRCRKQIYLGFSQYGEQGIEQRGPLLMAIQGMLRRLQKEANHV